MNDTRRFGKTPLAALSGRFDFLAILAGFIRKYLLKGNEWFFALAVGLGTIIRVTSLFGYALTLQAIVAAIRPDVVQQFLNRILAKIHPDLAVAAETVIPVLIGAILMTYSANWLMQYLRTSLIERLNLQIASHERNFRAGRSMDEDLYILEQAPGIVLALVKCLEIIMLVALILTFIALAAPWSIFLLSPLLVILVAVQVYDNHAHICVVRTSRRILTFDIDIE